MDGSCYSFDNSCFNKPPETCTDSRPAVEMCAPTVLWFWILTAAVGAAVVLKKK